MAWGRLVTSLFWCSPSQTASCGDGNLLHIKKDLNFSLLGIQRVIEYFSEISGWVWERAWGRPNTGGMWVPPLESNLLRGKNLFGRWGRFTNMAQDEEENWFYYSTWLLTCLFQLPRHMYIPKNKCFCMNMNKSLIDLKGPHLLPTPTMPQRTKAHSFTR